MGAMAAVVASASVASAAAKLAGGVGYALRRSRRVLRDGPRKDLIMESLAVAVSLLAELADTTPEFVHTGGLAKLTALACPAEVLSKSEDLLLVDAPVIASETTELKAGFVGSDVEGIPADFKDQALEDLGLSGGVPVLETAELITVPVGSGGAPGKTPPPAARPGALRGHHFG